MAHRTSLARMARWLGVAGAVLVPVGAVALTYRAPGGTYTEGQLLSAAQLTSNFADIKTAVDALEQDPLGGCQWIGSPAGTVPAAELRITCPTGTFAIGGGCDGSPDLALSDSRPFNSVANPPFPAPVTGFDQWLCGASAGTVLAARVLCCPAR